MTLPWSTNESKFAARTIAADTLSEYVTRLWVRDGEKVCHNCGRAVIYDLDSGYWLHAGFDKVDGRNGLYCRPEMWDKPQLRVYARPAGRATKGGSRV